MSLEQDILQQANARLVAAAPELLAALESLVRRIDPRRDAINVDAALAAIAKAKGKA